MREATPSLQVDESWEILHELAFAQLNRNVIEDEDNVQVKDLHVVGSIRVFDSSLDHVSSKLTKTLPRSVLPAEPSVSASDDPILVRLADEFPGAILATDVLLGAMMASTRSVNSWDIFIRKREDGTVFLDKRAASKIDQFSAHETSPVPLDEDVASINSAENLSKEATYVHKQFVNLSLKGPALSLGEELPSFSNASDKAFNAAFRYRKFTLEDGTVLIVRCQMDALSAKYPDPSLKKFVSIRTFHEFDPKFSNGVSWRQKLDSQKGLVLSQEFKNNAFKVTRWIAETTLGGSTFIRLGFVSRTSLGDPSSHTLLGVIKFQPDQFALQVGVTTKSLWGVLDLLVEKIKEVDSGLFMLYRVPSLEALRIYKVPSSAFLLA